MKEESSGAGVLDQDALRVLSGRKRLHCSFQLGVIDPAPPLLGCYSSLSPAWKNQLALLVWYSVQSDRAQREMLKAAVYATNSRRSEEAAKST